MAVTPEDVRNKQFTTVRFKEGYDLDEVDNFLDEIEESLAAVTREAEDLRATVKGEVPESIREEIRSLGDENARLKSELDQSTKALEDADVQILLLFLLTVPQVMKHLRILRLVLTNLNHSFHLHKMS